MKTIDPGHTLTVVLRNDAPLIHCNDSPSFRSVRVELTPEQIQALQLQWTHGSGNADFYENVSKCFIESDTAAEELRRLRSDKAQLQYALEQSEDDNAKLRHNV